MTNLFRLGKSYPTSFLEKLYEHNIRRVHSKVELLNWEEKTIGEIDGIVTNGTYSVDGKSPVRRNVNLTLSVVDRDNKLVHEYIDLSRKIRLWAGLENYTDEYPEDEIIWFNLGVYLLVDPSYSHSVGELRMTLQAQDKMALMNGTIGGVFNTTTRFVERNSLTGEEVSMPWREIFYYAATVFGEEDPARVVVEGVPDYVKEYVQVKSVSGLPERFVHVDSTEEGHKIITRAWSPNIPETEISFSQGERLYKLVRFGPPDPVKNDATSSESYAKGAGEPISNVFSDIVKELGNVHEFFYNTNGDLVLQKIRSYINDTFDPTEDTDLGYANYEFEMEHFVPDFSGFPFAYDFTNKNSVTAYTNNPSWTNVKNDFIVEGKDGHTLQIAIDKKPTISELKEWFRTFNAEYLENPTSTDLNFLRLDGNFERMPYWEDIDGNGYISYMWADACRETKNVPVYIEVPIDKIPWQIALGLKNYMIRNVYSGIGQERVLPRWGRECESMIFRWGTDSEKAYKRNVSFGIFNPATIEAPWLAGYEMVSAAASTNTSESLDFNRPIFSATGDPTFWMYFLDLIDEGSRLGKYSINRIGKRTKVTKSEQATALFRVEPTSLVVLTETELANLGGDYVLQNLRDEAQAYAVIQDEALQYVTLPVYTAQETRGIAPYAFISGNPDKNENQYLRDDGIPREYLVGGYFNGVITPNKDKNGNLANGYILVEKGKFIHPGTKETFDPDLSQSRYSELYIPVADENFLVDDENLKSLQNMVICFIRNRAASGMSLVPSSDPHLTVCRISYGVGMEYLRGNEQVGYEWSPFNFDTSEGGDVIVATIDHNFTEYSFGDEVTYTSSKTIDGITTLFNIVDSNMVSLFDRTGSVDCLSVMRKDMYLYTNFAEVITINCLPIYHLEPNTLIRVKDEKSNIDGVYLMTSYNIPFSPTGDNLMNINAIKVYNLF